MRNIIVAVGGGADLNGEKGAWCKASTSYKVGDRVSCINGVSEFGDGIDDGRLDASWTASTKGFLRINGSDSLVAQGKVAFGGYSAENSDINAIDENQSHSENEMYISSEINELYQIFF